MKRLLGAGADVGRGDEAWEAVPVYEVARVHAIDRDDLEAARRLAEHERLDPYWRARFRKRLDVVPEPS